MQKLLISASAAAVTLLMSVSAGSAGVVYTNPNLTGGQLESPGSVDINFNSPTTKGSLNFTLNGFNSLDGVNYYEDDFTLTINGSAALKLSYDLGGGGGNQIFTDLYGASVMKSGQSLDITLSSATLFNAGSNTVTFAYDSPSVGAGGQGLAGPQGLGDEGWGVGSVVATAAPEPATWAMMLLGFVGLGFAARRTARKSAAQAV